MWILSRRSKEMALHHAELETLVLQRTSELQILSQRLLSVQDEERRKLARDLHDSTGQTLAALKINVALLEATCPSQPSARVLMSEVAALADQAIQEIRTMSYLLHPPLLDEVGFACAAEWYVEGFAKRSGIHVSVDFSPGERLPKRVELALFRVLQESLTNVHRHSGASTVKVNFKRDAKAVILEIRDFGRGFSPERLARLRETSADAGVGLAGMRERIYELTGRLELESDAGGTTVRATVPLYPLGPLLRAHDYAGAQAASTQAYQ
jgi:signal transduction histidine kinase